MWLRKLYRRGDSVMVTIPVSVRNQPAWAHVQHVQMFYEPPRLVIVPLSLEELVNLSHAAQGAPGADEA